MSKWPMQGHFRYLRFKTFPMTPRTPQCEVFWALLSNPKHLGVPEDSKSPTLEVLGFTPTLGQSGVATKQLCTHTWLRIRYQTHSNESKSKSQVMLKKNGYAIFLKYYFKINLFLFLPTTKKGYACHHH
jgi:hypothetical protein